jgi:hypothetical protein
MPKKSAFDLAEATLLRDWCLEVLSFLQRPGPPSPTITGLKHSTETAFAEKDIRRLKAMRKDLAVWARELPEDAYAALDAYLASREWTKFMVIRPKQPNSGRSIHYSQTSNGGTQGDQPETVRRRSVYSAVPF